MLAETVMIGGVRVPRMLYGTAWKEDRTRPLVEQAIQAGFRGIDTANQRKHYHEAAVGEAIAAATEQDVVSRDELFLQTKFTPRPGQDRRLPYDPEASVSEQVEQSLVSSLEHLRVDTLDSYVLHGPSTPVGLAEADWQAWQAMEAAQQSGRVRLLGISNVQADQLELLCDRATVPPHFVQNRCFARTGWDRGVRQLCGEKGISYQGFSLLTANQMELSQPQFGQMEKRYGRTIPQLVFRFALDLGMIPLTGTTDRQHMRDDLAVFDFQLDSADREALESLAI